MRMGVRKRAVGVENVKREEGGDMFRWRAVSGGTCMDFMRIGSDENIPERGRGSGGLVREVLVNGTRVNSGY